MAINLNTFDTFCVCVCEFWNLHSFVMDKYVSQEFNLTPIQYLQRVN